MRCLSRGRPASERRKREEGGQGRAEVSDAREVEDTRERRTLPMAAGYTGLLDRSAASTSQTMDVDGSKKTSVEAEQQWER